MGHSSSSHCAPRIQTLSARGCGCSMRTPHPHRLRQQTMARFKQHLGLQHPANVAALIPMRIQHRLWLRLSIQNPYWISTSRVLQGRRAQRQSRDLPVITPRQLQQCIRPRAGLRPRYWTAPPQAGPRPHRHAHQDMRRRPVPCRRPCRGPSRPLTPHPLQQHLHLPAEKMTPLPIEKHHHPFRHWSGHRLHSGRPHRLFPRCPRCLLRMLLTLR